MRRLFFTLLAILITISINAQEVVQWRGENRDGIYNETGLLKQWPEEGPKLLWHYDKLGDGHGSAAVANDKVFTTGTKDGVGFVIALDHNGNEIWTTSYGNEWIENFEGVRTTPMIHGEKLYIYSSFGLITCMNKNDGKIIWKVDVFKEYGGINIKWGVTENLVIHNDKLFCTVGGPDANIIALNKDNGKLIWKNKGKGEISAYCSPNVFNHNGRYILVTQTANTILGLDAEKGTLLWTHDWPNQYSVHANTSIYRDGQVYVVSGYGKGGVMLKLSDDGNSITELWTNSDINQKSGHFVVVAGKIYGATDRGMYWYCIDWNTGKTLYSANLFKSGVVIYADGLLYMYSEGGEIVLVEPKADSFNVISKFRVPYGQKQHWAHPVIAGKKMYIRHGGSLMVYDIAQ